MRKKLKAINIKYKILLSAIAVAAIGLTIFTPDNIDSILILIAQAAVLLVGR